MRIPRLVIGTSIIAVFSSVALAGGIVNITPEKDGTLYEFSTGALANGAGEHLFSGETGQSSAVNDRRAVMEFDVASAIPSGATITSARLRLNITRASSSGPFDFSLFEMLTEWGEGTSDAPGNEGSGTAATPGDATWIHAVSPGTLWATAGGDFDPAPSATTVLNEEGQWNFFSTPELVSDVQGWLDTPASNHGWMLKGPEPENGIATVKRLGSRENADTFLRPTLIVSFTESSLCLGDCDDNGEVNFNDLVSMLFLFGTDPGDGCDADENSTVDFNDLVATLFLFGPCP